MTARRPRPRLCVALDFIGLIVFVGGVLVGAIVCQRWQVCVLSVILAFTIAIVSSLVCSHVPLSHLLPSMQRHSDEAKVDNAPRVR